MADAVAADPLRRPSPFALLPADVLLHIATRPALMHPADVCRLASCSRHTHAALVLPALWAAQLDAHFPVEPPEPTGDMEPVGREIAVGFHFKPGTPGRTPRREFAARLRHH